MKLFVLLFVMLSTAFATDEVSLKKYDLIGIKRKLNLKELGKGIEGYGAYVQGRIIVQGGYPEEETIVVLRNIYKPDRNDRYKFRIGYKTERIFMPSGNIKRFRMKKTKAVEYFHSGLKKDLFKYIFEYVEENKDRLTGEIRYIVKPYTSTNPYYTTGTVQFILK